MAAEQKLFHGENQMSKTRVNELQSLVAKLHADREGHLAAIAQIDAAFDALGIKMPKRKKRGRKPGKKKAVGKIAKKKTAKKTKRKKFKTSANELVLATVKKGGAKGSTGAQISKAWKTAGRPGDAYNTLGVLFKEKKIKREKIKGAKGSVYRLA